MSTYSRCFPRVGVDISCRALQLSKPQSLGDKTAVAAQVLMAGRCNLNLTCVAYFLMHLCLKVEAGIMHPVFSFHFNVQQEKLKSAGTRDETISKHNT